MPRRCRWWGHRYRPAYVVDDPCGPRVVARCTRWRCRCETVSPLSRPEQGSV